MLREASSNIVQTPKGKKVIFDKEKYIKVINEWLFAGNKNWVKFSQEKIQEAIKCEIFTICFENIDVNLAEYLHSELQSFPPYLGSLEVDDTSKLHWMLYSNYITPKYRMLNNKIRLFWDGFSEESKDYSWLEFLTQCGFNNVEFESLEGKYSIFDKYHDFEHARRVAEWRKTSGNLLAFLSDDVVCKLLDAAPTLGDKLWAAYKTFEDAEIDEEYAQVTASCRRIIEYVADCLFPPVEHNESGRELKGPHYKNRLLAYADNERKSETNIDVVLASTNLLSEQIDKLSKLVNKGIHSEIYREEARRCLIRTVMLLDDFISLKKDSFKIETDFISI